MRIKKLFVYKSDRCRCACVSRMGPIRKCRVWYCDNRERDGSNSFHTTGTKSLPLCRACHAPKASFRTNNTDVTL